jgi:hypothetical protein
MLQNSEEIEKRLSYCIGSVHHEHSGFGERHFRRAERTPRFAPANSFLSSCLRIRVRCAAAKVRGDYVRPTGSVALARRKWAAPHSLAKAAIESGSQAFRSPHHCTQNLGPKIAESYVRC